VSRARNNGQELLVHDWIYSMEEDILKNLDDFVAGVSGIFATYSVRFPFTPSVLSFKTLN
jgi:hypothetical protein